MAMVRNGLKLAMPWVVTDSSLAASDLALVSPSPSPFLYHVIFSQRHKQSERSLKLIAFNAQINAHLRTSLSRSFSRSST